MIVLLLVVAVTLSTVTIALSAETLQKVRIAYASRSSSAMPQYMVSIFRFSAAIDQTTDGLPFPINAGNQTDLSGGDVCE